MAFRAYQVQRDAEPVGAVTQMDEADLPPDEVLIRVQWSGLNYKDAMTTQPGNRVARISPLVPGVDLAGVVETSRDPSLQPGTPVLVHGYDLGVAHHGGFAELARVPADWVVPLPRGLDARSAMAVGTAGFTAFLSVHRLEAADIAPSDGPVLVTGASGGVGSLSVALLAHRGFTVVASTGKADEHPYLRRLGATEVIGRDVGEDDGRVLGRERFAAAVDCVGGATLAAVLRSLRYGGAVAASGLTGGTDLDTTVYPFIIRGVALLGVDSVQTPIVRRRALWSELARTFPLGLLDDVVSQEIGLAGLPAALEDLLASRARGRILLAPSR